MGSLQRILWWVEPIWRQGAKKATLSLTSSAEYEKKQWKSHGSR